MLGSHGIAARVGCTALLLGGLFGAVEARGAALPVTATLEIELSNLFFAPVTGAGTAIVNGSGGGPHVSSLALDPGLVSTVGLVTPITDPASFPILGLHLTAANGTGALAETTMGALGGTMPLLGVAKACLFQPCGSAVANLSVPLSVIGAGGSIYVAGNVNITVVGAPWTTATATAANPYFTETRQGFRSGPAQATSSTAQPSGVIQLVTPFVVYTSINVVPIVGFAHLTLHFVPEPVTLTMLGAGVAALAAIGRRRRAH